MLTLRGRNANGGEVMLTRGDVMLTQSPLRFSILRGKKKGLHRYTDKRVTIN